MSKTPVAAAGRGRGGRRRRSRRELPEIRRYLKIRSM